MCYLCAQVGPFIDSTHSSFQEGLVEYDGMMLGFEDIFLFKGTLFLLIVQDTCMAKANAQWMFQ
jgi:hypothetical protein